MAMNALGIMRALDEGLRVFWVDRSYEVIKGRRPGDYFIKSSVTGHCISLAHSDGNTLNGKESEFFIDGAPDF
jgi:hypothetical protein